MIFCPARTTSFVRSLSQEIRRIRKSHMTRYIHCSRSLVKQLDELRENGKKAVLAAIKCEGILADIKQFGCQCGAVASKRTRNGEQRIKNCIKYDLGGGYRLVTIRVDNHLFIPFAGSHDETNQWIERHRYDTLAVGDPSYLGGERIVQSGHTETTSCEPNESDAVEDPYENQLQARLDESQLRSVFRGLFMEPHPSSVKAILSVAAKRI